MLGSYFCLLYSMTFKPVRLGCVNELNELYRCIQFVISTSIVCLIVDNWLNGSSYVQCVAGQAKV